MADQNVRMNEPNRLTDDVEMMADDYDDDDNDDVQCVPPKSAVQCIGIGQHFAQRAKCTFARIYSNNCDLCVTHMESNLYAKIAFGTVLPLFFLPFQHTFSSCVISTLSCDLICSPFLCNYTVLIVNYFGGTEAIETLRLFLAIYCYYLSPPREISF